MDKLKKIEEMTDLELIEEHRKMWNWLAEYYMDKSNEWTYIPNAKRKYVSMFFSSEDYNLLGKHSFCFACYYARQQQKKSGIPYHYCTFCFFECNGGCINGLFTRVNSAISRAEMNDDKIEIRTEIAKLCRQIAEAKTKEERKKEFLTTDILFPDGEYTVNLTERSIKKQVDDALKQPSFTITIDNTDLFDKLGKIGCHTYDGVRIKNGNIYRYPLDDVEGVIYYVPNKKIAKTMLNVQYGTGAFHVRDQFQCREYPGCFVPIRPITGPFSNC